MIISKIRLSQERPKKSDNNKKQKTGDFKNEVPCNDTKTKTKNQSNKFSDSFLHETPCCIIFIFCRRYNFVNN